MNKIAFIVSDLKRGGAQSVFVRLANYLSRKKSFKVTVISLTNDLEQKENLRSDVEVISIDNERIRSSFFPLINILREENFDSVISTLGYVNLLVAMASFFVKGTVFYGREGNILSIKLKEMRFSFLYKTLVFFLYRRFETVVMQSKDMEKDFLKIFPSLKSRIMTLNNPIEFDDKEYESVNNIPNKFVFLGKLEKQKGLKPLIPHLQYLKEDFQIEIYGKGSEETVCRNLILKHKYKDKIHFKGITSSPKIVMAKASALILPSLYEGFPNVVIESLSVGTPVIAFECPGGLNEILNEENGVKVAPGDYESFIQALESFESKRYNRTKIKENIKARYDLNKIGNLYASLLAKNRMPLIPKEE